MKKIILLVLAVNIVCGFFDGVLCAEEVNQFPQKKDFSANKWLGRPASAGIGLALGTPAGLNFKLFLPKIFPYLH
jgi:hypothetical protein